MDNLVGWSATAPTVPGMTQWQVPGYDDLQLLGFGTAGEVWAARERSSGDRVALRRILGGNVEGVAQVRAAATVLRSLPSPHLVRVRTTLRAGQDDVVVLDLADGGPLTALVGRRGSLSPGEVVTAVAPLAEALGQAHAHRLRHGRLGLSSVLLAADGMPLLDGLATAALHDAADGLDPTGVLGDSADVWALGELCRQLLTGMPDADLPPTTPLGLREAVEAALSPDMRSRPTAADLAAALLAACPALPLGTGRSWGEAAPPAGSTGSAGSAGSAASAQARSSVSSAARGRRSSTRTAAPARSRLMKRVRRPRELPRGLARMALRRPWRSGQLLAAMASGVVLLLVVVAGWVWGGSSGERPGQLAARALPAGPSAEAALTAPLDSSAQPVVAPPDPSAEQAVAALDAARAEAFAAADPAGLQQVYAPGSAQAAQDAAAVADLARLQRRAVDVSHDVRSVRVVQRAADRLDLDVVEALRSYRLVDLAGKVLSEVPAGPDLQVHMLLRRVGQDWRVERVSPGGSQARLQR